VTVKYDTLLTNCGFRVGFVSKYILLLLNITFFSLPCQCVYIFKSDFVNVWTSEICVRLIRFLNRTISNSVKLSKRLTGLNRDRGCTCVHSALQRSRAAAGDLL